MRGGFWPGSKSEQPCVVFVFDEVEDEELDDDVLAVGVGVAVLTPNIPNVENAVVVQVTVFAVVSTTQSDNADHELPS